MSISITLIHVLLHKGYGAEAKWNRTQEPERERVDFKRGLTNYFEYGEYTNKSNELLLSGSYKFQVNGSGNGSFNGGFFTVLE